MKNLLAVAGLLAILANPAAAAIDTSKKIDQRQAERSNFSCKSNIIRNGALTIEFKVSCGGTSALFVYSPVERLYCDPNFNCGKSLKILTRNWFGGSFAEFK